MLRPGDLRGIGRTPDYRFTLANERTYLAWVRTALALVGSGVAVDQFLPELSLPYAREVLAAVLVVLGAVTAVRAVLHWHRCEQAMRLEEDLPTSVFPGLLAGVVALLALALVALLVAGGG